MSTHDEELEALLKALAPDDAAREALEEEHRQLEKDLYRLADPLPPADFVAKVMAKVEAQPARAMSRADVVSGIALTLGLGVAAVVAVVAQGSLAGLGSSLASVLVFLRDGFAALGSTLALAWRTSPVALVSGLGMSLMVSLVLLRRVGMAQPEAKVS